MPFLESLLQKVLMQWLSPVPQSSLLTWNGETPLTLFSSIPQQDAEHHSGPDPRTPWQRLRQKQAWHLRNSKGENGNGAQLMRGRG